MPRIFTGLEVPKNVAQSLSILRGGLPGARWIDKENYHVTLRFIGDVDDDIAHEVESLLGMVRRAPFELRIEGLTSFGSKKPRQRHVRSIFSAFGLKPDPLHQALLLGLRLHQRRRWFDARDHGTRFLAAERRQSLDAQIKRAAPHPAEQ